MKLYQKIANLLQAMENCRKSGNTDWFVRHAQAIRELEKQLPNGAGFDAGTVIALDISRPDRFVLNTSYHHMNADGFYVGWTEHQIVVKPAFVNHIHLIISGPNKNDIKDYIHDVIYDALVAEFAEFEE